MCQYLATQSACTSNLYDLSHFRACCHSQINMYSASSDRNENAAEPHIKLSLFSPTSCKRPRRRKIRGEEIEIDVGERKFIDIEEKEILRKEKEQIATVKRPAEAQAYKLETLTEGHRTQTVEVARADAEKIFRGLRDRGCGQG